MRDCQTWQFLHALHCTSGLQIFHFAACVRATITSQAKELLHFPATLQHSMVTTFSRGHPVHPPIF